jgi:two-component system, NarL family, sensor kinase
VNRQMYHTGMSQLAPDSRGPCRVVPAWEVACRFAIAGLVALLSLAAVLIGDLREDRAEQDDATARQVTAALARAIVEPRLGPALSAGDKSAVERFDADLRRYVLHDPVVRVKLWSDIGRVLYASDAELIGRTFPLGPAQRAALYELGVESTVDAAPPGEYPEAAAPGRMLQVYAGLRDGSGHHLLFEAYFLPSSGKAVPGAWRRDLVPMALALVAVELAQFSLGWFLARRLRRHQRDRQLLVAHAADASNAERRRIVGVLHDSVVQDLTGMAYLMEAAGSRPAGSWPAARLAESAQRLRASLAVLRSVLVDVYPPDLHRDGLPAALAALTETLRQTGMAVRLSLAADADLPHQTALLLFRAAQEALRNVAAHSGAREVEVDVGRRGDVGYLVVRDDGRGFEPGQLAAARGHFGLRALRDLVTAAGGRLRVRSSPGQGTTVEAEVPLR